MEKLKKVLLGMGYLTWMICNIAVVYGIGWGAMKLLESESVGQFILHLAFGMVMLLLVIMLSILCLGLVAMMFGDEKMEEKVEKIIPETSYKRF
jgi:uncharacterized membrane protein YhdT